MRVHVERIIQRLKIFKILSHRLDLRLMAHLEKILRVAACLVNLQGPIIAAQKEPRKEGDLGPEEYDDDATVIDETEYGDYATVNDPTVGHMDMEVDGESADIENFDKFASIFENLQAEEGYEDFDDDDFDLITFNQRWNAE